MDLAKHLLDQLLNIDAEIALHIIGVVEFILVISFVGACFRNEYMASRTKALEEMVKRENLLERVRQIETNYVPREEHDKDLREVREDIRKMIGYLDKEIEKATQEICQSNFQLRKDIEARERMMGQHLDTINMHVSHVLASLLKKDS